MCVGLSAYVVNKKTLRQPSLRVFLRMGVMRLSMSQMSSYYHQNREAQLEYQQTVVACECGAQLKRQGMSSHRNHSPRHKIWADMMKSLAYKKQGTLDVPCSYNQSVVG